MGVPNHLLELADLVVRMRAAQARYFQHRSREYLVDARNLEALVDRELARIHSTCPLPSLDRGAGFQPAEAATDEPFEEVVP